MKKLITISGLSYSGKSSTLRFLYQKIIENFPNFKFYKDFQQMLPKAIGDFQVVIVINGKLIGIESQGDPSSRIFETLPIFVKLGCDIVVCATRTRGKTVELVDSFKDRYQIVRIEKNRASGHDNQVSQNEATANEVIALISAFVFDPQ